MRILVAGATGVIGRRLVPLLISAGHEVAGITRSDDGASNIAHLGAEGIVCDVFDAKSLISCVSNFKPDVVWNQLSDLPDDRYLLAEFGPANNRIRREGTVNLLNAANAAGAGQFISQSVAWQLVGDGGRAVLDLERAVRAAGGVIVRYGQLYGPGTYYQTELPEHPRIHVDEAAKRSLPALEMENGVLTVIDEMGPDDPD